MNERYYFEMAISLEHLIGEKGKFHFPKFGVTSDSREDAEKRAYDWALDFAKRVYEKKWKLIDDELVKQNKLKAKQVPFKNNN